MNFHFNYKTILIFVLTLSNVASVYFIYPFIYDFEKSYDTKLIPDSMDKKEHLFLLGTVLGLLFSIHAITKVFGNFLWKKLSMLLGLNFCINMSLVFLIVLNGIICFTKNIKGLLILRALLGIMNGLPFIIKTYICEIFNSDLQIKMIQKNQLFSNVSLILSFLIGALSSDAFYFIKSSEEYINSELNLSVNKFYLASSLVVLVNFIALIMNLIENKCRFSCSRRISSLKEHFDFVDEKSVTTQTAKKEKSLENDRKENTFSVRTSTLGNNRNMSLVLYNNEENEKDKSFSSDYIESIMDKDEVNEDYNPNNLNEMSRDREGGDYEEIHNKHFSLNTKTNDETPLDKNEENTFGYNKVDYGNDNLNDNKNDQSKAYEQIENDTKLITNNPIANLVTNRIKDCDENVLETVVQIEFSEIPNQEAEKQSKIKYGENNIAFKKIEVSSKKEDNSKRSTQNKSPGEGLDDIKKKITERKSSSIKNRYSISNSNSLAKQIQIKNSFKISLIFSIIYISEVCLFNLLIFIMFIPDTNKGLNLSPSSIGLVLSVIYLFFTFIMHYSNFDKKPRDTKRYKKILKVSLIITIIFTALLVTPILIIEDSLIKQLVFYLLYLIKTVSTGYCLQCYNNLVAKIENSKLKEKINWYQSNISQILIFLFGFLSCLFIFNIYSNDKESDFILFCFTGICSLFISGIFFLVKYL